MMRASNRFRTEPVSSELAQQGVKAHGEIDTVVVVGQRVAGVDQHGAGGAER